MTNAKRILGYYRRYKWALILGALTIVFSAAIKAYGPSIVRSGIDDIGQSLESGTAMAHPLTYYGVLLVAVSIGQGVFLFLQRRILVGMSRDIEYDLRNEFYEHLQRLSSDFYVGHRTGDLMARATSDLNAVRMMAGPSLMYGFSTVMAIVFYFPLMLRVSVTLTLLSLCTMPLISIATKFFAKRIHDRFEKVQEEFAAITARAQENLTGMRVVRAYGREDTESQAFESFNRSYVERNRGIIVLQAAFYPILRVFTGLALVAVLWYGGGLVIAGEITIGQFVEFNLYLTYLIWPMIAIGWVINLYQRGMASMGRMNAILNSEPTVADGPEARATEIKGGIEFRNLTFAYPGTTEPVLKGIDLRIDAGQTVAIVGRTGSGKSTLINLVPRLLDAEPGMVLIDGRPIREHTLESLRASIGYVQQETFLFSETVAANIAFGAQEATVADVEWASEHAGLADDIHTFPKGFDTLVGERGITLSGGQKQRTAIARAVIRRPSILILDDALSAVDTYTEERILGKLRSIMRERTSLIVSHRVSTVKDADLIVVLDDGRIAERGNHDALLAHGGLYAELYERQLLEDEIAAS